MSVVPVVIPYFGRSHHLLMALESAAAFNNDRVVLVGDEANRLLWPTHVDSARLSVPRFDEFVRTFDTSLLTTPEWFEMACFRRYFVVEAWMRQEGIDRIFLLDGDVLTFADYARDVLPVLEPCRAALVTVEHMGVTSAHVSYWTIGALSDFIGFCVGACKDPDIRERLASKCRWHLERPQSGGVCDMTLLHWWRERNVDDVPNLADARLGIVGDLNVTVPANYLEDEYETRDGFKRFVFRSGHPYGVAKASGKRVRFCCIHCQGTSKALMRYLHTRFTRRHYLEAYKAVAIARTSARYARAAASGILSLISDTHHTSS